MKPEGAAPTSGSLLLIARHYPPAVTGGARRPYLLAQALRRRGLDVFVIAPALPDQESGLAVDLPFSPPDAESGDPAPPSEPKWRAVARELVYWPDPDIRWSMRALGAAMKLTRRFDWVMTTSPPESAHVAGWLYAARTATPWIADFRDHWLVRPHRVQRRIWWRRTVEGLLARLMIPAARLVTAVDPVVASEIVTYGPPRLEVLPHFAPVPAAPEFLDPDRVNVLHTGSFSLSDPDCDIGVLITGFATARRRNPALKLHLVGRLSAEEVRAVGVGLDPADVTIHGLQPFARSLALQSGADGLVYVGSRKTHVPPSKIVEYLAAGRPIIAFGEGSWRGDPRVAPGDPIDMLADLARQPEARPPETLFDAEAAATAFLAALPPRRGIRP